MMDENTQKLDPADKPVDEAAPSTAESEAAAVGWLPKDQFKGRESDWVDAETFIRRSRELGPIKQANVRLARELDEAKSELKELKLTTKEFAVEFAKMRENAYKRAIGELKAQRREALKDDDHETADALEERIDSLKEEQAAKAQPAKTEPKAPDLTIYNEWHKENKWYDEAKEPELFDAAEGIALRLSRNEPGLVGRPFMDRVTELVKARFPDKFENPRRKAAPHEGGGLRGESKGGKGYSNLPPEAKQACDRYVKQGIMTREQYIDAYEWD